jgi:hypothetical protein
MIKTLYRNGPTEEFIDTITTISRWVTHHFSGEDLKLAEYIRSKAQKVKYSQPESYPALDSMENKLGGELHKYAPLLEVPRPAFIQNSC